MEKLPVEVLTMIFEYLSHSEVLRCALVCKEWTRIARQRKFFGKLEIGCNSVKKLTEFCNIFRTADVLPFSKVIIDIYIDEQSCEKVFQLFEGQDENIHDLEVFLGYEEEMIELQMELLNRFSNIEHLKIHKWHDTVVDFNKVKPMETVKTLTSVDLVLIEELIPKLPNLQKVYFNTREKYPKNQNWEKIHKIADSVPKLELDYLLVDDLSNAKELIEVAKPNMKVKEFEFQIYQLHFNLIHDLCQTYSTLENLTLWVDEWLTPSSLADLAKHIPNLREMEILGIEKWPIDYALDDLAACKMLQSLTFNFDRYLKENEEDTHCQLKFVKKLTSFPCLRKFKIVCESDDFEINDAELEMAFKSCPKLVDLKLNCNPKNFKLQSVTNHLKGLKKLHLQKVPVYELTCFNDLHYLEELVIGNAEELADVEPTNGFQLKALTTLKLWGYKNLTGAGFEAMIAGCPFLETLNVSGAKHLEDVQTENFLKNLKYIKELTIR